MNAHALAAATYGNPSNAQKTARTAEYQVIARITSRLQRAHADRANGFAALAEALTENRRLWTEFAIDLASTENTLPDALKLQLLQLANFTLRHTEVVLRAGASADVLIDINIAIMRGLAGKDDAT
ncbi:MAG: flagellar biosynthesis regulator FlaF [Natronohydrobacter sp.]|nr:flagellar biosynthesis regulator FlaF [Natronohydrobacter sp.]